MKGQKTTLAERIEIGERWRDGENDQQIANVLERPKSTIRKWRRRNEHAGRSGLSSHMGRPATGALGQFPGELSDEIFKMRRSHPGWGARTILVELKKDARFGQLRLPQRSQIAEYLKEKDLVRKYERHHELPEPKRKPVERAHQEWEVDAQGKICLDGLGSVSIINIEDVFSSLKIESLPCPGTTHANTQDYQLVLRRAFVRYGLPEQISFDHDSVFYDNQTPSPFPTKLHLWLLGLGIEVRFIHQPPPTEHARIERTHQIIEQQALLGQTFSNISDVQKMLSARILFLDTDYPSRASNGQPPLTTYPQAHHSQRPYRLEWEKELLDIQPIYNYLAKGRWFRLTSSVGMFTLGDQRYNASTKFSRQTLEITFDPLACELICLPEKATQPFHLAVKGLTKEVLIGELDPLTSIPAYQLELPFSRQAWREIALTAT